MWFIFGSIQFYTYILYNPVYFEIKKKLFRILHKKAIYQSASGVIQLGVLIKLLTFTNYRRKIACVKN